MQQQLAAEAARQNMSVEQYISHLKAHAMKQAQQQQQQQAQKRQAEQNPEPQHVQTNNPSPPSPEAIAVAKYLRGQNLKTRTSILNGQRKDMFKGVWPNKHDSNDNSEKGCVLMKFAA